MAHPFLSQLELLVKRHAPDEPYLECKHFFNGAALYARGIVCASLTPVGLAFKLPVDVCSRLIESGAALPLRYFSKSPIKKDYALFSDYEDLSDDDIARYFIMAVAGARPMAS